MISNSNKDTQDADLDEIINKLLLAKRQENFNL